MRRRAFLSLVGLAAAWPLTARAQAKTPIVGVIGAGSPASHGPWIDAMVARLKELGWVDGGNVKIEYRWAEGQNERVAAYAAEFAERKVDVIVSSGPAAFIAAKAAPETPIVAAAMGDPIKAGVAQSLAHPGGNVTGSSIQTTDLAPKRIQLLREIALSLRQLAVMGYATGYAGEMESAETYAKTLGLDVTMLMLKSPADIAPAFESVKGRSDGLYLAITPFTTVNRAQIIGLALDARLPIVTGLKEYVASGALVSYGTNFDDVFRRAGDAVDRILRGEKPGDLPIQQSTKFDLAVNLKTAKALGLVIPSTILASADEVIE
jgi:putative tryptophan/tyrosine transport system substrate-binding protein